MISFFLEQNLNSLKRFKEHWPNVFLFFILLTLLGTYKICAQNINGEKILVGRESITIINFPDKVLNINFSDDAAYDYYVPKRREEKSISLQFNKSQQTAPNTNLLVNEGGRSHMFRVVFDSTYDINDDTRPPLWYDHSSLKELKAFVQNQQQLMAKGNSDADMALIDKEQERQRMEDMDKRKAEVAKAQQRQTEETAMKEESAKKQNKAAVEQQKEQEAALAKAKREVDEKEKQIELAKQKEIAEQKEATHKAKMESEALAKQRAADELRIKKLKEQQKKDELEKAQADADERAKLQQEAVAKQKIADEEKKKKAAEALAKKEADKKAAQEKLAELEALHKQQLAEKAYSEIGLWQRYGKQGIDVYNYPAGQMAMVNADFFIIADTLRNFRISDSLINSDIPDKVNVRAGVEINGGVRVTLENIAFKDVHTYYKVKIENTTKEDFLLGKTYMYWYDQKEQAKMIIKCSYLTYIKFYPIIRPHTTQYIVFATRSPNVIPDESLVLFIEDRRKEKGSTSIVIPGNDYIKELAKVQASLRKKSGEVDAEKFSEDKKPVQPSKRKR